MQQQVQTAGGLSRRGLLATAAGVMIGGVAGMTTTTESLAAASGGGWVRAKRPRPPYRVWFQPRMFERDPSLYSNMTLDASGWLDPRLAEAMGKTALGWVYGLNNPWAKGPEYWRRACGVDARARPIPGTPQRFVSAGVALDEWVPPKKPQNPAWLRDGLRAGRAANPEIFIAVWTTDSFEPLFELGRDGTVDLILVEGYTHAAAESGPGLTTSWGNALHRCELLAQAGLVEKTVFCFGHITAKADARGQRLKGSWLRERAEELKQRYPKMPGVAFYEHAAEETAEQKDLIRFCDRLSGELWAG